MVLKYQEHSFKVEDWVRKVTPGLSSSDMIRLFEKALSKLWDRSCLLISEVTVAAILDRALSNSVIQYPVLLPLKVSISGIQWAKLRKNGSKLKLQQILPALIFLITEFIAIASSITDGLLSKPLHDELNTVILKKKESRVKL